MVATDEMVDLFVIGGGINGCGIARDAVGRGLSVTLCEKDDLAQATSSSSTKLFHGGLRYLEYYEFRLVREALIERETLLTAMPHISWPMRFVLPHHKEMRPAWLIRLGLFLYDNLGGRKILPGTKTLDLRKGPEGAPLKDAYTKAFEYSDCWVEDSRLVALNARDAEQRGARIMTRTKCISATRVDDHWDVVVEDENGAQQTHRARGLVNAGGPWVEDIIRSTVRINSTEGVRLVRGSHIVVKKQFDHDKAYFMQGRDGRIMFAIPYETDFTLIGTTDKDHRGAPGTAECTDEEAQYMIDFASEYFAEPLAMDDIVWRYSGVRPLYDDGASSATAATRDYVLSLDKSGDQAPLLNVFGGKITTYRRLAESAMAKLTPFYAQASGDWTARVPLPGGDFPVNGVLDLIDGLMRDFPFLDARWAKRLVRAYGTEAREILGDAGSAADLGEDFGATLTEAELRWLVEKEYVRAAADAVWRRSKLGLRLTEAQIARIDVRIDEMLGREARLAS
ncbi:MAG: glycerol-3-phosphate dehydrogenase [Pseudomonadota bacterium]